MKKTLKKIHTLLHLNWGWAFRYYTKHLRKWANYYFNKARGKTFYDVTVNGTRVKLAFSHPYHHLIAQHLARDQHEHNLLCAWREQAISCDTILDVGSYNGIYAVVAGTVNPTAQVTAFEPEHTNLEHINRNIRLNGLDPDRIRVFSGVVSGVDGALGFSAHDGGTGGSIGSGEKTNSTTLDSFLKTGKKGGKTLIKLDVEGAEYDVLTAAKETLKGDVTILLEVHKEFIKKFGRTTDDLYALIKESGYKLVWLDENALTVHYWMYK